MSDEAITITDRPDLLLVIQEGLSEDIELEFRARLDLPGMNVAVVRRPNTPYAGIELYLPSAIALFVAAGFFNGVLQEAGKDCYALLKEAAVALSKRAEGLNIHWIGSPGKVSKTNRYSLAYSITGEIIPGLNFKFLIQCELDEGEIEVGIGAFIDLINDLINDQLSEDSIKSLLTYKPVGGTVLVTFDATNGRIVPVNAFE